MKKLVLFVLFLLFFQGFNTMANDEVIGKCISYLLAHKDIEDADIEPLVQQLKDYLEKPLLINSASFDELIVFPFFSSTNAMHIIYYRTQKSNIRIKEEFDIMPGFNDELIELIQFFISYDVQVKFVNSNSSVEIMNKYKRQFQKSKAYDNNTYLGDANYYWLRIVVKNVLPNWTLGMNIEKDAGEKLITTSKQLSYQTFFLSYKNEHKIVKKIIIGDCKVSLGQGLVHKSGFNNLKNSFIYSGNSFYQNKLLPHSSVSEYGFLKGLATEIKYKKMELVLFSSFMNQDANLQFSPDSTQSISTIYQTGLHRTNVEIENRDQLIVKNIGSSLSFVQPFWNVSWNQNYSALNKTLMPSPSYYNSSYLKGKNFFVQSIDANVLYKKIHFFSETALDQSANLGFILGANHTIIDDIDISVVYRNYSEKYQSFYGQSFQENTHLSNEKGFFTSLKGSINSHWNFFIYQDVFSFPGMKYQMRSSSSGTEHQIQLEYVSDNQSSIYFRIKNLNKTENINVGDVNYQNQNYSRSSFRLHFQHHLSENWIYQARIECSMHQTKNNKSQGVLLFQDLKFKRKNFSTSARITCFNTDDFDSRIYVYENNVLYAYPIQFYQNSGISFYLNSSININQKLTFWLLLHHVKYFNVDHIGSGNDEIKGNKKSQITFQARWKF